MNYKDIVLEENTSKVYMCKLKDGRTLELQIHDDCESSKANYVMYNFEDSKDLKEYLEEDIEDILEQVEYDWYDDLHDSFKNLDFKAIEKYLVDKDVYYYSTKEELAGIIRALDEPIVLETGYGNAYDNLLRHEHGLVYYYTEYDDYSCYGDGYTHFIKIISGAKIV